MPRVELINTGTELLLGGTINKHLAFLAQELFPLGLRIQRQITVPDGEAIREALSLSLAAAEIVLVTGGLGPTSDDITREIAAELLGLELCEDPVVLEAIVARFRRRGILMKERMKRQARVPRGATVLPNPNGTAPGLYLKHAPEDGAHHVRHVFLLPGPPRELHPMFRDSVAPILRELNPALAAVDARTFRVAGLGESNVEALVGEELLALPGLELGYRSQPGEVEVRCIGRPDVLLQAEAIVTARLGGHIFSRDNRSLEEVIVAALARRGQTLAIAESCTGGFVAHRVTNVPGASAVFLAGFVTYANEAKINELAVDPALLAAQGAVSREVAVAMAEGARRAASADYAVATTGIAGPGGGTEAKPVGTVYIALAARNGASKAEHHVYPFDRETFKFVVSQTALNLLRRNLHPVEDQHGAAED